jgi:hypothetical protein
MKTLGLRLADSHHEELIAVVWIIGLQGGLLPIVKRPSRQPYGIACKRDRHTGLKIFAQPLFNYVIETRVDGRLSRPQRPALFCLAGRFLRHRFFVRQLCQPISRTGLPPPRFWRRHRQTVRLRASRCLRIVPSRSVHPVQTYALLQVDRKEFAHVQRRREKNRLFSWVILANSLTHPIPIGIRGHPTASEEPVARGADLPREPSLVHALLLITAGGLPRRFACQGRFLRAGQEIFGVRRHRASAFFSRPENPHASSLRAPVP